MSSGTATSMKVHPNKYYIEILFKQGQKWAAQPNKVQILTVLPASGEETEEAFEKDGACCFFFL